MFSISQTFLFKNGETEIPILTSKHLEKVAPKHLQVPDASRVVVKNIKVVRVCNDRPDVYSVVLTNPELMNHVSVLRDPDANACLAVLDPLSGYELNLPEKQAKKVTIQEVADDPLIDSEFPNNTLDVTSVLFVWAQTEDRTQACEVNADEQAKIILEHRKHGWVINTTEPLFLKLVNHTKEIPEEVGNVLVTLEMTLGLVESLAINDKPRRSPPI